MARFQFFGGIKDQVSVIEVGAHTTKGVYVQQKGDKLTIRNYLSRETPKLSNDAFITDWTSLLKEIKQELNPENNRLVIVLGLTDALFRQVVIPEMPVALMRQYIKINAKTLFQEDIAAQELEVIPLGFTEQVTENEAVRSPKRHMRVLVFGLKSQVINDLFQASRNAGWMPVNLTYGLIGIINAASLCLAPEQTKEPVALIDVGHLCSTITLVKEGKAQFSRIISIGSYKITHDLAAIYGVNYSIAEGLKVVLQEKVEGNLKNVIAPLGQELRAAVNFFEAQENQHVDEAYFCGGALRSSSIFQLLHNHLEIPCKALDPSQSFDFDLSEDKKEKLRKESIQITSILGIAAAEFKSDLVRNNFWQPRLDAIKQEKRDPAKWMTRVATVLLIAMVIWITEVKIGDLLLDSEIKRANAELERMNRSFSETIGHAKKIEENANTILGFSTLASNRFLWTGPLNALQYCMVPNIEVLRLKIQLNAVPLQTTNTAKDVKQSKPPQKQSSTTREIKSVIIQAKDSGNPAMIEKFIEAISSNEYFKENLRKDKPVLMLERLPKQVDPTNPNKDFVIFTLECYFQEREY